MKKRLYMVSVATITVSLIISFLIAIPLVQNIYRSQVQRGLKDSLILLSNMKIAQTEDMETFIQDYAAQLTQNGHHVRITLIDLQGNVLCDSKTSEPMENHLQRPEIQQALNSTWGFDSRTSQSITKEEYYYAAFYPGGTIIYRLATPLGGLSATQYLLWGCAAIGIIIGLVLAFSTARITVNYFLKPIHSLIATTREITAGNLSVRAENAPAEMGELSTAFNIMTERLETAHKELENSRDTLNSILSGMDDGVIAVNSKNDILLLTPRAQELLGVPASRKKLKNCGENYAAVYHLLKKAMTQNAAVTEEFQNATPKNSILHVYAAPMTNRSGGALAVIADVTRIKMLEQIRSEFVANVTHELKTPLTSIRGYIELLKDDKRDSQTRNQFYEIIEIEAERLQNLIDDILALSVIEHGHEDNIQYSTNILENAQIVTERLKPVAEKAEVQVTLKIDPSLFVNAAPSRLQQLIWNLTENAIKYNKKNGTVQIIGKKERGFHIIQIKDTGIGIKEEHLPRIFERFYRVDKGRSRQMGGTGLGLSIVKHIVNLYHGDISVESVYGNGTVFTVRFPQFNNND